MNKISNWLKSLSTKEELYIKPQKFIDAKRNQIMTTSSQRKKTNCTFLPPMKRHIVKTV